MKHNYLFALVILFTGITQAFAQAPKISSFSPATGSVGTKVTINGTGFAAAIADNAVYFGATRAVINRASNAQLLVTVPAGATYKPIYVINTATRLVGQSALAFSTSFAQTGTSVAKPIKLPFEATVSDIRIADIDGDGKSDILATNQVKGTLMVFRNKSKTGQIDTGSFAAPAIYQTGSQSNFVSVEDLDGDGNIDIVLMNMGFDTKRNGNNSLSFFKNSSQPGKIKLLAASVTDSTAKAAATYSFRVKPGDYITRIADFDGDGKVDIGILNNTGFISIYNNKYAAGKPLSKLFSAPVTIPVGFNPSAFVIGDIDKDGKPDIISASRDSSTLTILRNTSVTGSITASSFKRVDFKLDYRPITVSLMDADKDGNLDIAISRADNKLVLIHNRSTPGRINVTNLIFSNLNVISNYSNDIVMQDADGDGKPDLLSLNAKLNEVNLYPNKSVPGQTQQAYFNVIDKIDYPLATIPDCIGDLDGDGRPDMIIGNYFGIDIYQNKPSGAQALIADSLATTQIAENMMLYPNPASSYTNVKYSIPAPADEVSISLHDNFGRLLKTFKTGQKTAGEHTTRMETSELRMGLYVVTVTAGTYKKVGKLFIE